MPKAGVNLVAGGGVFVECMAIPRNAGPTTGQSDSSSWDSGISDAIAHLIGAHFNIEALIGHPLEPVGVGMSLELASQAVWAALVSLDECGLSLGSFGFARGCSPEQWSSGNALTGSRVSGGIEGHQGQLVDRAVS
jgi:hypothetical protein